MQPQLSEGTRTSVYTCVREAQRHTDIHTLDARLPLKLETSEGVGDHKLARPLFCCGRPPVSSGDQATNNSSANKLQAHTHTPACRGPHSCTFRARIARVYVAAHYMHARFVSARYHYGAVSIYDGPGIRRPVSSPAFRALDTESQGGGVLVHH